MMIQGRYGSDEFTKFWFESGYTFSVPLDADVSVEVVVTKKSNTIRNFLSTVLQCPVLVSTAVSTLKMI